MRTGRRRCPDIFATGNGTDSADTGTQPVLWRAPGSRCTFIEFQGLCFMTTTAMYLNPTALLGRSHGDVSLLLLLRLLGRPVLVLVLLRLECAPLSKHAYDVVGDTLRPGPFP